MTTPLPPLHGDVVEKCFGWHALNYRTADTPSAQDAWSELERFIHGWGQQCYEAGVAAERERQATECERLASLLSGPNESDGEYAMWMNRAAAIRNG